MRQIGSISNVDLAERFADHLRAEGIACTIDAGTGGFRVWIHEDDRVAQAKDELPQFLADPNHERYRDAGRRAAARLRENLSRQQVARAQTVVLSDKWSRPPGERFPVTIGLIAMTCVVAYFTGLHPEHNDSRVDKLWFSNDGTLQPILHGEVWRIITPIFLHFGLMHFVFNMMWLYQLGMLIELRKGTLKLSGMVLAIAALSNFAEFEFSSPWFGGMSGVVYGLFGYIWIKGKLEPESGFELPQQTVTMMLVWFVLCFVVIPDVANWAHGAGLLAGIAIAASGKLLKPLSRPR
jgi:GlpG protein